MSDLLNQASLVMVPSGYKEDTVYSVVPSDGSGDLSFTRASNGTRVNSAGLVEVVPWNLLQYSEDFSNAYWTQNNCTVTANNTTAPNGTLTADLITSTGTLETGVYYFPSVIGTNTWSVYAKKGTGRYLFFNTNNPPNIAAKFDLQDGVIVGTPLAGATPSIESVGNGWYRCIITSNTAENRFTVFITNNTTTDDLTSSVGLSYYLWGAQLNIGSTAKPYFPTTDRLNVPRLTYQNGGGGCPSLLLEKQSTNLLPFSEDFSQWFSAGGTVTTNTVISPDGTQNADTLTGARYHVGLGTGIFTFSCYAKKVDGDNTFQLRLDVPATISAVFNLNTGTIVSTPSGYSATIEPAGNGWYRCTLTSNSSITITNAVVISANSSSNSTYVWGGQCEASSYPTSYIPTTSSSATRVADGCSKTGISSLIGGTSGTVFFDIKTNPVLTSDNYKQFFYYTDSSAAQGYMYLNSGNGIVTNPSFGNLSSSITLSPNTRYKIALTYANNDFALYVNGTSVATASSGTPLNFENLLSLGSYIGTSEWNQFVFNQYTHFKSRLTNAELASLTTI